MSVAQVETIDFVAHDPNRDEALLVLVEERPWQDSGALLQDLQAKLNSCLQFVVQGKLGAKFPNLEGKPVHFQLRASYPPGERELGFLRIVCKHHLAPAGIRFSWRIVGEQIEHGV